LRNKDYETFIHPLLQEWYVPPLGREGECDSVSVEVGLLDLGVERE